ncbi:MAG TPA: BolA family protein [Acidobacteriota bacterium]|nr:BolA family protein [Acidobacteriota bacterium]
MQLQTRIESKLQDALHPDRLEVVNESGMHNVAPGSETHFRVFVVSAAFTGETLVRRHQRIYQLLDAERRDGIHALGIQTLTPEEFADAEAARIESPPCLGGDGKAQA